VQIDIYDVNGRLVRHLVGPKAAAGMQSTTWDGKDAHGHPVPSGVFLYVFQAGDYKATGRLMVVR
jgi:flagellar hook assembly protein FlgD